MKENALASTLPVNIPMRPSDSVDPSSFLMNRLCQTHHLSAEVHVVDNATQQLLEENNQLLGHISANLDTFKIEDNADLVARTGNNIKAIFVRMNEMPGIMSRMPPLPVSLDGERLNSVLQLTQMALEMLNSIQKIVGNSTVYFLRKSYDQPETMEVEIDGSFFPSKERKICPWLAWLLIRKFAC